MRKLVLVLSLCLCSVVANAYTCSYSADDVNNRVQDAIDSLSDGSGQINSTSLTSSTANVTESFTCPSVTAGTLSVQNNATVAGTLVITGIATATAGIKVSTNGLLTVIKTSDGGTNQLVYIVPGVGAGAITNIIDTDINQ